jgi:hypothetical protein
MVKHVPLLVLGVGLRSLLVAFTTTACAAGAAPAAVKIRRSGSPEISSGRSAVRCQAVHRLVEGRRTRCTGLLAISGRGRLRRTHSPEDLNLWTTTTLQSFLLYYWKIPLTALLSSSSEFVWSRCCSARSFGLGDHQTPNDRSRECDCCSNVTLEGRKPARLRECPPESDSR